MHIEVEAKPSNPVLDEEIECTQLGSECPKSAGEEEFRRTANREITIAKVCVKSSATQVHTSGPAKVGRSASVKSVKMCLDVPHYRKFNFGNSSSWS